MTAADFDRVLADARRYSPDLLTVDDKCDVAFGRADRKTQAFVAGALLVAEAYYDLPRGGEHRD